MKYNEFIKKLVQDTEAYEFYTIFCSPDNFQLKNNKTKDHASDPDKIAELAAQAIKKEAKLKEDARLKKAYENYKNPIPDPFLDKTPSKVGDPDFDTIPQKLNKEYEKNNKLQADLHRAYEEMGEQQGELLEAWEEVGKLKNEIAKLKAKLTTINEALIDG